MKALCRLLRTNFILLILIHFTLLRLDAQDYHITFVGTGATDIVNTVKVENVNRGTDLTMNGNDVLHLVASVTGIGKEIYNSGKKVRFFPNPFEEFSRIQFELQYPGETFITIFNIAGKEIVRIKDFLSAGIQTYRIEGLDHGIYMVRIKSGNFSEGGRLVSNRSGQGAIRIQYENTKPEERKLNESGDRKGEVLMEYSAGDRLKFTGMGGQCSSVMTDVTSSDKTITFDFIPCTDGDNNIYPVIKIGDQVWMAINLKTTKYNDGTDIPMVTDDSQWAALKTPGFCWYLNEETPYKNLVGGLYNFYTVATGKLCPAGWHVPSHNEWKNLENYLIANGYNYDESVTTSGNKLGKALASTAMIALVLEPSVPFTWEYSSEEGAVGNTDYPSKRNATGFSALPAGERESSFVGIGRSTIFWTSTGYTSTPGVVASWYRFLGSSWYKLAWDYGSKQAGHSVRCMKN